MGAFAFILLMVTALGGTMVLVEWYDDERRHAPDGTTAVVFSHVGLALISLVLLAVLAVTGCGKKSSLYLQPGRENVARAEPTSAQPASSATGNSD